MHIDQEPIHVEVQARGERGAPPHRGAETHQPEQAQEGGARVSPREPCCTVAFFVYVK